MSTFVVYLNTIFLKISKEVRTAILVLGALVLLIFGYNYLKGNNLLDKDRNFYAVYDNVEGLAPGASVTINGLSIGKVISIKFADKKGKLIVHFSTDTDFEFSNKSTAQVYGTGFISGKNLSIIPNFSEGRPAKNGDTLPSSVENGIMDVVNERLVPLQTTIESAINDTDSLVKSVNSILNTQTQRNLRSAISDFALIAREMKGVSRSANSLLENNQEKLTSTISNLDKVSTDFTELSGKLSNIEIETLIANMEKLLSDFEGIANNLTSGKGTAGKLLQDEQVYVNLERTSKQMELLLEDMRLNPKRYVHFSLFGKKAKEYTPPKDSLR